MQMTAKTDCKSVPVNSRIMYRIWNVNCINQIMSLKLCWHSSSRDTNVPSIFLKSLCTQNFQCATFYQQSSIFRMTCMKYVETHFSKENLCALQVFLCGFISRPVCALLTGNIAGYTHCQETKRKRD